MIVQTTTALHCHTCPESAESACAYVRTDNFKAFPSSQLTFEGWLWFGGGKSAGLVEYQADNSLGQSSQMFAVAVTSTAVHVTVRENTAVVPLPSGHAKALVTQQWSHVAVTWEATKAVLQVFVNGLPTEDASAQLVASKNLFMQSGGSFRLGRYNDTLSLSSSSTMSDINLLQEVRLWSTALNERHISQTLRKTSMPSSTGIVAHWRLWGTFPPGVQLCSVVFCCVLLCSVVFCCVQLCSVVSVVFCLPRVDLLFNVVVVVVVVRYSFSSRQCLHRCIRFGPRCQRQRSFPDHRWAMQFRFLCHHGHKTRCVRIDEIQFRALVGVGHGLGQTICLGRGQ